MTIITSHVDIPGHLPWSAYRYGNERPGAYGYGTTREAAIADLDRLEKETKMGEINGIWTLKELEGMSEADKKILREFARHEVGTNTEIKKILRSRTKVLRARLLKQTAEPSLPENVTKLKKTP